MNGRVAAIDIGTNSVLLLVAGQNGGLQPIVDRATITRLGQGVDKSGVLDVQAVERTLDCIRAYAQTIRETGTERVAAVATSAMRDASNGAAFLDSAEAILGVRPEVISGEREAQLTFAGALCGLAVDASRPVTVFDIGGGSTEIIVGDATSGSVAHAVSLDIGSVRLTERHVTTDPPSTEEQSAIRRDVNAALGYLKSQGRATLGGGTLVGVAGTVTTLAAVARAVEPYDGAVVHGSSLTRADISDVLTRFVRCSLDERSRMPGLDPKRADVIIAGTIITEAICDAAHTDHVVVSDRGVRWGLAKNLARSVPTMQSKR